MLPALLRRCTALPYSPCQQFVSLSAFRRQRLLEFSVDDQVRNTNPCSGYEKRSVRTYARKRNIFLDPAERDDNMNTIASLYDSSRFNDDDDEGFTTSSSNSTAATPAPSLNEVVEEKEQDDEPASSPEGGSQVEGKLPPARNIKVKSAEFIKSSVTVPQCPAPIYPEFAVIGRSNVGKSSLINLLTGRNSLAMVSKTPGKTRCINHFLINKSWYLVDLPGYGYAKTSKENVLGWNKFTRDYFLERETLVNVMLLVDASIPPMEIDLACANWLGEAEVPYTLVYTKVDKRKKGVPPASENIAAFEAKLQEKWDTLPAAVCTSSRAGTGKNELLTHIARLRSMYNTNKM